MILVIRLRRAQDLISVLPRPPRNSRNWIDYGGAAGPRGGVAALLVMSPRSVVAQMAEAPGTNAPDWGEGIE